jgi:hypothetical protein
MRDDKHLEIGAIVDQLRALRDRLDVLDLAYAAAHVSQAIELIEFQPSSSPEAIDSEPSGPNERI